MSSEVELSHFVGLFEGEGTITVMVCLDKKSKIGIRICPLVELTIGKNDSEYLFNFVKKYAHFSWTIYIDDLHNTIRISLKNKKQVKEFLEMIKPYIRLPTTKYKI